MPKAGSGFTRAATKAANAIQKGMAGYWRLSNPGDYTKDIVKAYSQLLRSGGDVIRDSRGGFKRWDYKLDQYRKLYDIAGRMAENVQEYQHEQAAVYSRMRDVWGKPVYVNSQDMREFRDSIKSGHTMLVNVRGVRGRDSEAMGRAAEGKWATSKVTNADVLREANEKLNTQRNSIWVSARKAGGNVAVEEYRREIFTQLSERFLKVERAAWRRRRNK